jgi:hypothetical protein
VETIRPKRFFFIVVQTKPCRIARYLAMSCLTVQRGDVGHIRVFDLGHIYVSFAVADAPESELNTDNRTSWIGLDYRKVSILSGQRYPTALEQTLPPDIPGVPNKSQRKTLSRISDNQPFRSWKIARTQKSRLGSRA